MRLSDLSLSCYNKEDGWTADAVMFMYVHAPKKRGANGIGQGMHHVMHVHLVVVLASEVDCSCLLKCDRILMVW